MFRLENIYIKRLNIDNYSESNIYKLAMDFILKQKFNVAFRIICKWTMKQPIQKQGFRNWKYSYEKGISKIWLQRSIDLMENSNNVLISATVLYSLYSGVSCRNATKMLSNYFSVDSSFNDTFQEIKYESALLCANINLSSYEESGIETYQFLAPLDELTCSTCGELDGKMFPVKEWRIGKNCPPMHKGCRCTTISTIGLEYDINMQRTAFDPSTGKQIKVPRSMNWVKWKEQYIDKKIQ